MEQHDRTHTSSRYMLLVNLATRKAASSIQNPDLRFQPSILPNHKIARKCVAQNQPRCFGSAALSTMCAEGPIDCGIDPSLGGKLVHQFNHDRVRKCVLIDNPYNILTSLRGMSSELPSDLRMDVVV